MESELELPSNFDYFDRETTTVEEKLIKEYGNEVCRNIIDKHFINNAAYVTQKILYDILQGRL